MPQVLLSSGQTTGVEPKLQAAERALQDARTDDRTRDLVGRIASVRALLVWGPHEVETIIAQSRRALEYLHPDNLPFRTATALSWATPMCSWATAPGRGKPSRK